MIHDVTNRYPMVYDRMFRTAIYQKAPSQIATVLWKWVPVLGSQTSQRVRPSVSTRIIHGVTNRYPMAYDRMFRTGIYQKAPSQIAMVLWKWVPVLGSQTSHRACPRVTLLPVTSFTRKLELHEQ